MRFITASVLGALVACGDQQQEGAASGSTPYVIRDADRRAMEDSVQAYLRRSVKATEALDSAGMLADYAATGRIVSVQPDGRVITNHDSLARTLSDGLREGLKDVRFKMRPAHVAVLSPRAAVYTAAFQVTATNPNGMTGTFPGVVTGVVEVLDNRTQVRLEHNSVYMDQGRWETKTK